MSSGRAASALAAFRRWFESVKPDRADLGRDAVAGLPRAIGSVPDGMASAVLAGVSPIHGLYASFAGPIGGGLTTSTRLMVVTTTSAAALAAGSAVANVAESDRPAALFLLTIMAGVAMVAAGLLRLGRFTRFVSHSVMIGFLTGVAANIILGQLPDLSGVDAPNGTAIGKAFFVLTHPGQIDLPSLLAGLGALAIVLVLSPTRLAAFSSVIALIIPTFATSGVDSVARVSDAGPIPSGFPVPALPDLGAFTFDLLAGALAVAAIVLVQGAGVAESAPNRDGKRSDPNQDFVGQGVGNIASSFFKGQPVGGSVGQTALNIAVGARSRWASIFSGLWMLVILVAFSGVVGNVAMPTLAAVLIYAAARSLRIGEVRTILRTGPTSQIAIVTTFLATLFLPVPAAVGIGVALSLLLQLNQEALDLAVVELFADEEGQVRERPAPASLPSRQVTVLDIYGSLLYAGARTLQARLPDPSGAVEPVVVLRLRGRTTLGSTAMVVLSSYASQLAAAGGRLYLSGVAPEVVEVFTRAGRIDLSGPVRVFPATEILGESSRRAIEDAEAWIVGTAEGEGA